MQIGDFALRDIILVLASLAGIYVVVLVLRLYQVARHKRREALDLVDPTVPDPVAGLFAKFNLDMPRVETSEPLPYEEDEDPRLYSRPVPAAPPQESAPQQGFNAELLRTQMESEIRQLQDEVLALRDEISELKAARRVSPQYADAMALAQRGLTAQDLADRCNISIGEAELVAALARGTNNFEEEDQYGGSRARTA